MDGEGQKLTDDVLKARLTKEVEKIDTKNMNKQEAWLIGNVTAQLHEPDLDPVLQTGLRSMVENNNNRIQNEKDLKRDHKTGKSLTIAHTVAMGLVTSVLLVRAGMKLRAAWASSHSLRKTAGRVACTSRHYFRPKHRHAPTVSREEATMTN